MANLRDHPAVVADRQAREARGFDPDVGATHAMQIPPETSMSVQEHDGKLATQTATRRGRTERYRSQACPLCGGAMSDELADLQIRMIEADLEHHQLVSVLLEEACDLFSVPPEVRIHVSAHYPRASHNADESAAVQMLEWLESEDLNLIWYGGRAAGMWFAE